MICCEVKPNYEIFNDYRYFGSNGYFIGDCGVSALPVLAVL